MSVCPTCGRRYDASQLPKGRRFNFDVMCGGCNSLFSRFWWGEYQGSVAHRLSTDLPTENDLNQFIARRLANLSLRKSIGKSIIGCERSIPGDNWFCENFSTVVVNGHRVCKVCASAMGSKRARNDAKFSSISKDWIKLVSEACSE